MTRFLIVPVLVLVLLAGACGGGGGSDDQSSAVAAGLKDLAQKDIDAAVDPARQGYTVGDVTCSQDAGAETYSCHVPFVGGASGDQDDYYTVTLDGDRISATRVN